MSWKMLLCIKPCLLEELVWQFDLIGLKLESVWYSFFFQIKYYMNTERLQRNIRFLVQLYIWFYRTFRQPSLAVTPGLHAPLECVIASCSGLPCRPVAKVVRITTCFKPIGVLYRNYRTGRFNNLNKLVRFTLNLNDHLIMNV